MKQVIFIGGAPFSGSTLLQFMLANDPRGFSCGEVAWLFRPHRPYHMHRRCACGDPQCKVWSTVAEAGEDRLYQTIFTLFPEVEFVIDSTKNPFWVQHQQNLLQKQGIGVKHLLIWKTPLEFAYSLKKRQPEESWEKTWTSAHRLYFSLIKEWRAVKYADLAQSPALLKQICDYVEIPYFAGKEEYWHKEHHTLGGNYSARLHLMAEKDANEFVARSFDKSRMETYRTIYKKEIADPALQTAVNKRLIKSKSLRQIQDLLAAHSITAQPTPRTLQVPSLTYSNFQVSLRRLKDLFKNVQGRYRMNRIAA